MRQSSQNSSSSCSEKLVQAKELETKFLASLSVRGALDPYVRNLCNNVRDLYESIILADHAFAEAHNVEQSLWHLHYRQIEDFRHRVSSNKGWSVARNGQASSSLSKESWTDLLQKEPALAEFKNFLVEASGFYHELIPKLRARCGLSPDLLDGVHYHKSKSVELKRCQQSCYRCLVNLGDYARYKEFYVGNDPASYDFSIAADFYRKAISHWPVDGQPHNQLAVLAVYVGDELLAVYHYFRSLAVEKPFPTTRENLTILFDKNRVKYEHLPAAAVETVLPLSKLTLRKASEGIRASRYRAQKPAKRGVTQKLPGELINCFFVRFVRLNGLLFTKTSLEKFEEVFSGMLHDMEQLLELDDKNLELLLGSGSCIGIGPEIHGAFGALKLIVILICTVENVKWGSKYTEASQQDVLFRYAFTAFLGIMGRLMQRCAEANDASSSPLLPAILVFLEWLACRPEMVQGIEACEQQSSLLSFFWKQCVTLLNRFCGDKNCKDAMDDSLEETSLEDSKVGVALWEDFELQGFSPLAPAHVTLLYAERSNGTGTEIKKDKHTRLHRLLATGKAIVSMLEGSRTGMLFNEDLEKFHLSGEVLEKKPYDESHGVVENKICRPVDGSSKIVATKSKEEHAIEPSYNKQACGDDEDEELIVFQPVLKEQPILALSGCNTAASEPLNDSASPFWKGGFSNGPSMRGVIVSSVPEVNKSVLAMKPTCLSNAIPMFGGSLPQVESCPADSTNLSAISTQLKDLNPKGNPASHNLASRPLFAQNWPDQTMMPPMQFVNGIESSSSPGFKKAANSLGVIGQPKQLQTCMLETIDGLMSHGLDGSYKLAYENFNGASQYGALPFTTTLNSSSQRQPPPPFIEKLNEEVQGKIYAGTASKLVESAAARTPTPTQKPQSLTSAVICPPPGFGPRPMKPAKRLVLGGGEVSNQQVGNEQPKLDDYCWLDDYKASPHTSNYEEKHKVFPGSGNSTYSLWSSDNNRMAQSGGGTFSYPPLMQLSHQEKKQNPAAQLQQQPLQKADDKETWSLFGPTAPFHWTSTIFS